MSQALGGPLPLSLLLFLKGLLDALWNASLQLAVGGAELSLQVAAAGKHTTGRKSFPVACLAFRMCLTSGLWYLTGSVSVGCPYQTIHQHNNSVKKE